MKILSYFREYIALKISSVKRQFEECVKAMATYSNFLYFDLNAGEIASYALCAILTSIKTTKDTWIKGLTSL